MFAFGLLFALVGMGLAFAEDHNWLPSWVLWVARPLVWLGAVLMTTSVFIALWWVMP